MKKQKTTRRAKAKKPLIDISRATGQGPSAWKIRKKRDSKTYVPKALAEVDRDARKKLFIGEFMETGRFDLTCKSLDIPYSYPVIWARVDPEFKKELDDARQVTAAKLEDAAFHRSVKGVLRPIYSRGVLVGTERQYSDTLTMFLLRGLKPHVYRDNVSHEHAGPGGAPVRVEGKVGLSDEMAEAIRQKIFGIPGASR